MTVVAFDPSAGPKGNVIWKQPYGGRSAPLVMGGRLYIIQGTGEGIWDRDLLTGEPQPGDELTVEVTGINLRQRRISLTLV